MSEDKKDSRRDGDVTLRLKVLNPQGEFFRDTVDIDIKHRTLESEPRRELRSVATTAEIPVKGLRRPPQSEYLVTITPSRTLSPQTQAVLIPARGPAELTFVFTMEGPRSFLVVGEVRREDGLLVAGARVRATHHGEGILVRLGEDITDGEGRYTISFESLPQIAAIRLRLVAEAEGGLRAEAQLDRDARASETVNLIVPMTPSPLSEKRIDGQILNECDA